MLLSILLFTFIFTSSLPSVEEEKTKMDQITEVAKTYLKKMNQVYSKATFFCKDFINSASLVINRSVVDLMNRFKGLKDRGEVKVEEQSEEPNDFEELTEEKMKELLKQFYEKMGANEEFESSEPEEEKKKEEEKVEGEEKVEREKVERQEV